MTIQSISCEVINRQQNFGSSRIIFEEGAKQLFYSHAPRVKSWLLAQQIRRLQKETTYVGDIVIGSNNGRISARFKTPDGNGLFEPNVRKTKTWIGFFRNTFNKAIEIDKAQAAEFDLF